jgi:hypothetical protein
MDIRTRVRTAVSDFDSSDARWLRQAVGECTGIGARRHDQQHEGEQTCTRKHKPKMGSLLRPK